MNKTVEIAVRMAGHAGEAVVRRAAQVLETVTADGRDQEATRNRWNVVTINKSAEEICPEGRLPAPLAELGELIEWTLRPAPGDKGTEVAARPREPARSDVEGAVGEDPRQRIRAALRDAKMLVETGEILQPTRPGSTHPSPLGMPIRLAVKRARGEGIE
ncbi:MAG TPA: hypothetical protein VGD72_04250 [Mycobacteriales bacterium]|jgi:hypothetical protein